MKKRSLFAAIAMLIVSALVLTSATYAWFQAGGDASITAYTSNTIEAGTGVQLKTLVANANWENTLTAADFTASSDHLVANWATGDNGDGKLHPVSSSGGATFKAYNINTSNEFNQLTPVDEWHDEYTFSVGTVAAEDTVTATLKIGGTAAAAARVAVFTKTTSAGSFALEGIYSYDDATYDAITTNLPANTADADHNAIATETGDSLASTYFTTVTMDAQHQTGSTGAAIDLGEVGQVGASYNTQVKVVVWLEGNDSDCVAVDAANKTITIEWGFAVPTT